MAFMAPVVEGAAGKAAASTAAKGAASTAAKDAAGTATKDAASGSAGGGGGTPAPGALRSLGRIGDSTSSSKGTPNAYRRAAAAASPTVIANAGGGALLGAVAYVLGLTYLRGGSAGVKRWMRAKFLNDVADS